MQRTALAGIAVLVAFVGLGVATRTLSSQRAGFGTQTSQGYEVSNVKYWTGDGSVLTSVNFDVNAPVESVSVRVVAGGRWYPCKSTGEPSWACPFGTSAGIDMNEADTLQVRAI